MKQTAWTIRQLYDAMQADMMQCSLAHERIMVKAICGKEIKQKAEGFAKHRKLTPGEIAIATQFGYKSIY